MDTVNDTFTDYIIDHSFEIGRGYGPDCQVEMLHQILHTLGPALDTHKLVEILEGNKFMSYLRSEDEEQRQFILGQLKETLTK
ncbi:hypothetical protein AB6E39_13895 [Vibrio splendidus]|uniref:hypothetical protein n=1 Tax=Vibrio TaxID=662 RepID=UPI000C83BE84|nr:MULTISPECIES: hypothetical protein [Vibrio]MCC4789156.1 hypothetical protein [Vibrio splendidus]PMN40093.1 hypothetical protein BCT34_02915 [Vibrio sp. 10N.261.45.E2]PMN47403.1 hypothetical protein BCT32_10470 [Vibrio sp. 10N.261.45.E11]CAK2037384.1 Transcriptional regulator [Vibrio crassostreae]